MKAISLWQPWAHAMKIYLKTIETRGWRTHYRGDLLICSAKGGLNKGELLDETMRILPGINRDRMKFGYALCVVNLYDCIPTDVLSIRDYMFEDELGDFSEGRFAWMTNNHRQIQQFPVVGRQGLFEVDDSLIKYI